jgi:hypothetical protein
MHALGASVVLAFGAYTALLRGASSRLLYSAADHRIASRWTTVFVVASGLGLVFCLFTGARATFGWFFSGLTDTEGTPVGFSVSGLYAMAVGAVLFTRLTDWTYEVALARDTAARKVACEQILKASLSAAGLGDLELEFSREQKKIEAKPTRLAQVRRDDIARPKRHLWPEGLAIERYADLQTLCREQRARLSAFQDEGKAQLRRIDTELASTKSNLAAVEKALAEWRRSSEWECNYLRTNPGSRIVVRSPDSSSSRSFIATRELLSPSGDVIQSSRFGTLMD